jgi:sulfite dehydrogenase (quinone) subunit SoeC
MHPAPSIIAFTVLSGLGFGLMVWLGAAGMDKSGWVAATFCALALILAAAGLLSSLFHLGNPQRFLLALTQWRSSWLSREALLALATFGAFTLYAGFWWLGDRRVPWLGGLSAALALATVFATAMIYAQMKSVPRWHTALTPVLFLTSALAGGALLAGEVSASKVLLAVLAVVQLADWLIGDRRLAASGSTLATATGLGGLGRLRLLEPPHTGQNYLLREMVFVLARRHTLKLRLIGLALAALLPLALMLAFPVKHLLGGVIVLSHLAGMIVLRWLFFAQAEHVVGLYYGKR